MKARPFLIALAALVIAALFVMTGAWIWLVNAASAPGPLQQDRIVLIEPGDGLRTIAQKLERAEIVGQSLVFEVVARIGGAGRNLQAGEFLIPRAASVEQILDIMKSGDVVQRSVTVPEGLTSAQIVALLNEAEGLKGHVESIPPEGRLLPETYYFTYGATRGQLLRRMRKAHDDTVAELWTGRVDGLPYDTAEDAVILASIVEKETGVPEERPLVAAVFINRLKSRMRLQSDPTVIYGITGGQSLGRPIRQSELDADNPYNTYQRYGLPPGPIANPGRAALAAAMNPADVEYLYFVADGQGGHVFSETLAEHNRNVAKWRQIRRARGLANSGERAEEGKR